MTESTALNNLPPGLRRLWQRADGSESTRGLSLDRIVAAAIEIADAEGLPALSMARLAERLGSAPMSLYRHVTSKDDLYDAMIDAAARRPDRPGTGEWRADLTVWVADLMAIYAEHPWVLEVPVRRPPLEPGQLDWLERGLRSLAATPLELDEKMGVVLTLLGYARGQAALVNSLAAAADPSFGLSRPYGEVVADLVDDRRFPALAAAVRAGLFAAVPPDASDDLRADADFGLGLILDGIAALVRRRG